MLSYQENLLHSWPDLFATNDAAKVFIKTITNDTT